MIRGGYQAGSALGARREGGCLPHRRIPTDRYSPRFLAIIFYLHTDACPATIFQSVLFDDQLVPI